jgi:hypothetical protein
MARRPRRAPLATVLLLLVAAPLLGACAQPPAPSARPAAHARRLAQELEERVARLQLLLLEKDAQVRLLNQQLEAGILEVVRAMAKLRGLDSKAEAASNLAETEIAMKSLPKEAAGRPPDPDLSQAEQLLAMAAAEFKKENYGGTVFLTTQAKTMIKARETRSMAVESLPKTDGEIPFALPLSLRALSRSNIREGPGPASKVVFAVEPDAPLTAYSYKGLWVRVKANDGRHGWIYYNRIDQR